MPDFSPKNFAPAARNFFPIAPLAVGFSGGRDSTSLLFWLWENRLAPIVALHLHHGLRGKESDDDAEFCREFCRARGIEIIIRRTDVSQAAGNLEATGRVARWRFFAEICQSKNLAGVLLAHHHDDQLETVAMRLQRKSGVCGQRGMRTETRVKIDGQPLTIWRPWLDLDRDTITEFANANHLTWREDASNRDLRFARNRYRLCVFPDLAQSAPDYRERLEKIADDATTAYAQIPKITATQEWGGVFISRPQASKDSTEISAESIAESLRDFLPPLRRQNYRDLQRLLRGEISAVNLPDNYGLRSERDGWFVQKIPAPPPIFLNDEIATLPFFRKYDFFSLAVREATDEEIADFFHSQKFGQAQNPSFARPNFQREFFAANLPLTIRLPSANEKFVPFGGVASQTVKAIRASAKIPARRQLPLLIDNEKPIWLAGARLAETARITASLASSTPPEKTKIIMCGEIIFSFL